MLKSELIYSQKLPSFNRFLKFFWLLNGNSLTRILQYEFLDSYEFHGRTLDFGGGEKSLYRARIKCKNYESANIDSEILPTWLLKEDSSIPVDNATYDTVLSMNTLEHIFDAKFVLLEFSRILKSEGELVMLVPFLYPIHGHPDDFFRPTPSWYQRALTELGFTSINVTALAWGPFSVGTICSGVPGPFKIFRKRWALFLDWVYAHFFSNPENLFKIQEKNALAFLIIAKKG